MSARSQPVPQPPKPRFEHPDRRGPIYVLTKGRPRLGGSILVGLLALLAFWLIPNDLRWSTRAVLAWDAGNVFFLTAVFIMMCGCGITRIQARAAAQDEGQGLILGLSIVAACTSVLAIGMELSLAKDEHGWLKDARVFLAFFTICVSWLFIHVIFALHYAHEYYSADPTEDPQTEDGLRGGLNFPGGEPPDYWDFFHFSVIIGVASQTADIEFTSRTLRRIGTIHGLVAFAFNTVVLALTINLLAGLF